METVLDNRHVLQTLADAWKNRREELGIKKGTVKDREGQLNYMVGAVKILELTGNMTAGIGFAVITISVGRDLVDEFGTKGK